MSSAAINPQLIYTAAKELIGILAPKAGATIAQVANVSAKSIPNVGQIERSARTIVDILSGDTIGFFSNTINGQHRGLLDSLLAKINSNGIITSEELSNLHNLAQSISIQEEKLTEFEKALLEADKAPSALPTVQDILPPDQAGPRFKAKQAMQGSLPESQGGDGASEASYSNGQPAIPGTIITKENLKDHILGSFLEALGLPGIDKLLKLDSPEALTKALKQLAHAHGISTEHIDTLLQNANGNSVGAVENSSMPVAQSPQSAISPTPEKDDNNELTPPTQNKKDPSQKLLEGLQRLGGHKFKLSRAIASEIKGLVESLQEHASHLTGAAKSSKTIKQAMAANLKDLHNQLESQECDYLGAFVEKLEKGDALHEQDHTDLTHFVKYVSNKHDEIPQEVFEKEQLKVKTLSEATDSVVHMFERELRNGGSMPAMFLQICGVDTGKLNEVFTGDFKSAVLGILQGKEADGSKLETDAQKRFLSVVDWGIYLAKKLPKWAVNILPKINLFSRFLTGPLSRMIPGFHYLYGPLSLAIDFIGVNTNEMERVLKAVQDIENQGSTTATQKSPTKPSTTRAQIPVTAST